MALQLFHGNPLDKVGYKVRRIIGNPDFVNPEKRANPLSPDGVKEISSNGRFLVLTYNERRHTVFDMESDTESKVLAPERAKHVFAIGIFPDGTFIGQSEDWMDINSTSRRPFIWKSGNDAVEILPPPCQKKGEYGHPDHSNHSAYCACSDGTIYGWAFCRPKKNRGYCGRRLKFKEKLPRYRIRRSRVKRYENFRLNLPEYGSVGMDMNKGDRTAPCIWEKNRNGKWNVFYFPENLCLGSDGYWFWPKVDGTFLGAERWEEFVDKDIPFHIFDRKKLSPLTLKLYGNDAKIFECAEDGSFRGCFRRLKEDQTLKEGDDKHSLPYMHYWNFLARPHLSDEALVLSDEEITLEPVSLAPNGKLLLATYSLEREQGNPLSGPCLLNEVEGGYRVSEIELCGWRIDGATIVRSDRTVYCTATCMDRGNDFFRLTLCLEIEPA